MGAIDSKAHPALKPGIRSQAEMCEHFIPIILEKGTQVHKMGKRLARPARAGEEVLTIINGEVCARTVVNDSTSMVVRQESADHELYVLDQEKFLKNYETPGYDLPGSTPRDEELRERGFMCFERKGKAYIYQVTEEDMEFVPANEFQVSFSSTPQPLRAGDYLVTGYPDSKEVYMSRHATIYNDDGKLYQGRGVRSQEEMKEYFIPLMKERGMKMRRAGKRLARPAKKGDEVLTIINGEVVAKQFVREEGSMIVQEESADREIYVLNQKTFQESYVTPGTDIIEKGPEFDELRARGFKYYEKTKGMVLLYRVTAEDMQFVPGGKFQVPFSLVPQPLRIGDYLVAGKNFEEVYLSRNAEQIFLSRENLEVHYVFASPFAYAPLSINAELEGLRTSGAIVRLTAASRENLLLLKKAWSGNAPAVLHMSCHTGVGMSPNKKDTGAVEIVLEDLSGRANPVEGHAFVDLVIGGGPAPQVVVLNSCQSELIAKACLERGVRRVVAVRDKQTLLDRAARDFTFTFYGELRAHQSVETAFEVAIQSMRTSQDPQLPAEAEKLILLPEGAPAFDLGTRRFMQSMTNQDRALEQHIAVRVPFGVGEAGCVGPLHPPGAITPLTTFVPWSRKHFIVETLACFSKVRVIKVSGMPGIGKKSLVREIVNFAAFPGGRLFAGGAVVIHNKNAGIISQTQMCEHFIPILKKYGTLVQKVGKLLARPAKKGETVRTEVNGEVVAQTVVRDSTSKVIRHDSVDHELYVLDDKKFQNHYKTPGEPITERGPEFDTLRERGFKYYERKGMVLIYKVTEEDMKFVPEGKFEVPFSTTPQPVKAGDYLVTQYPEAKEIYMTRNAEQIYLSKIVKSQEEICQHFIPIIQKFGKTVVKVGKRLARPGQLDEEILTMVNDQILAKTLVTDQTSMVIIADSADREMYILNQTQFSKYYKQGGIEITEQGPEWNTLREQGFKWYDRQGMARVYQVSEDDLKSVPGQRFWGPQRTIPQPLEVGDYLVTGFPDATEVYLSKNAEQVFAPLEVSRVIRSQEEMREHFIPILKEHGVEARLKGKRLARPVRKGECIQTIIDGEIVAKTRVSDESSMVVREESCDRELYVLSKWMFQRNYETPGMEVTEKGPEFDALRKRGFKYYRRQGTLLLYPVQMEDLRFVSDGFQVSFSEIPQPLKDGDYLATAYPDADEVYLSRNAEQIYGSLLSDQPSLEYRTRSTSSELKVAGATASSSSSAAPKWQATPQVTPLTSPKLAELSERVASELSESICEGALKQAKLVAKWYQGATRKQLGLGDGVWAAVDLWMTALPTGSKALLVLSEGARVLRHDVPRNMLRRLLMAHKGLCLLIMVSNQESAEGPPLDPHVQELARVVPVPALTEREAAEVFLAALLRRQHGKLLGQMSREEVLSRLEQHQSIRDCRGIPGDLEQLALTVNPNVQSLDDLFCGRKDSKESN